MTEEMKKKLQTKQRRMMRMITKTERKTGKCLPAAHAESVDDTPNSETHDPDSELKTETTEPNSQDPNEQEESCDDADSNPSFDDDPNDEPADELQP